MESHATPTQDKQVTVDVPAERLPEFYAMYARFLAGRGRGRRGRGPGHRHHHHGGGCGHGHGRSAPHTEPRDAPVTEA
jgi:hypothetical protein